jgi:hypothetical protein
MLYKVTPAMPAQDAPGKEKRAREPGEPRVRKKRKSAVYDHEGHEVLISLMCLKCKNVKPLMQFGLRKMADGAIRNQPWCRGCRSGAGTPKPKPALAEVAPPNAESLAVVAVLAVPELSPVPIAAEPTQAQPVADAAPVEPAQI